MAHVSRLALLLPILAVACGGGTANSNGARAPAVTPARPQVAIVAADATPPDCSPAENWTRPGCDDLFTRGVSVPATKLETLREKERACNAGSGEQCYHLALAFDPPVSTRELADLAKARLGNERSCALKDGRGCLWLAERQLSEDKANLPVALDYLVQSCDVLPQGCLRLGQTLEKGASGGPPDPRRGYDAYRKACEGHQADGCARVALVNLRAGHENAVEMLDLSCEEGSADGCYTLGDAYQKGSGTSVDLAEAADAYERGCKLESRTECSRRDEVVTAMTKRCDAKNDCGAIGTYWEGRGATKQATKAYKKGCDRGQAVSCALLGVMLGNEKGDSFDVTGAAAAYRRGCALNNSLSCNNLGIMYDRGRGLVQNRKLALSLFLKSCRLGDTTGCDNGEKAQQ